MYKMFQHLHICWYTLITGSRGFEGYEYVLKCFACNFQYICSQIYNNQAALLDYCGFGCISFVNYRQNIIKKQRCLIIIKIQSQSLQLATVPL